MKDLPKIVDGFPPQHWKSAGVPPSLAKPSNVSAASSASKHLNGVGNKVGQLSGKFGNHFANSDQNQQQPPPANPSSKPNGFPNMNKFAVSDDWWNGQIDNGPIGMFPSSYVKSI
ncbi:hypothetical protein Pst134EB_028295 [Puccinia striiformis f. sp. tritici]|nr:hypothetical protein Pst134EB_028295 [Puccinia striiformis f. sp. tritici]